MPPLGERTGDVPLLLEYYASRSARKVGRVFRGIGESAMAALSLYSWPGNIRELQNAVERAVILTRGSVLGVSDFELPTLGAERVRPSGGGPPADERKQIEEAVAASRGRVSGESE